MAKSTAERQAAYRARQDSEGADGNGQRRVSMWLSTGAALALARLARRYGVTQREFVENILIAEDERVLAAMAIDTHEWNAYFTRKRIYQTDGTIPTIEVRFGKADQRNTRRSTGESRQITETGSDTI